MLQPDAVKKSWAELTETERVAAKALGHHQRAWNSKLTQRAGALQNAAGRLEALGGSRGAAMEDVDVEVTLMTEAGRSALTLGATVISVVCSAMRTEFAGLFAQCFRGTYMV